MPGRAEAWPAGTPGGPAPDGMLSVVVPVYRNEATIERLLEALTRLAASAPVPVEVVFVIDGSPDGSHQRLRQHLPRAPFAAQLVSLTRNFGSFNAIRAGLERGRGDYFAVLTADLQEPPELALEFLELMRRGEAEVTFGVRASRSDPFLSEVGSRVFWFLYRKLVIPDLPAGGVDVFGCTRRVRDRLVALPQVHASLIALLFWLGFRRGFVPYHRQRRREGRSAWTLARKIRYGFDSVFDVTNLPVQVLLGIGGLGVLVAAGFGSVLLVAKAAGRIEVPGYTSIALAVVFFGGAISLGLGIVGQYVWLVLQELRGRPGYVVASAEVFPGPPAAGESRPVPWPAGAPGDRR